MAHTEIRRLFEGHFGVEPDIVTIAPGRVNLIGEHTDYNDGFVFPAAINRGLVVAAKITDSQSELFSYEASGGERFDASTITPGLLESWTKYPAGMAWEFGRLGNHVPNVLAYVTSDIPMGSGVSSSAAIEMAFGVMWNHLGKWAYANESIARIGQICENQFVGVNSGIMDQMASAMGRRGMAMFLDTRSLEIQYAPLPEGLTVVLCDTKKPRTLAGSAYNERRAQCEEACKTLAVPKLRDASLDQLKAAKDVLSPVVFNRAHHVITENERCIAFRDALSRSDLPLTGQLMAESHASLRDDYEVSCFELDAMAVAAQDAPGCIGARMTGAGFGGACVALVQKELSEAFVAHTLEQYRSSTGISGDAMVCEIEDGARVLHSNSLR
jgi:galactokinase